jgi:Trypsin-like peptidase domain
MSRVAWSAAASLGRCTGRVEVLTANGWRWRGTAFFVGSRTLLTCAHVVTMPGDIRVVMYVPCDSPELPGSSDRADGGIMELPVTVAARYPPDVEEATDAYPLPDIAVLQVPDTVQRLPRSTAWLDTAKPGDDLYAFGYTNEYRQGQALGHPARFQPAGTAQVDQDDPRLVWRMKGDRVRPGFSGAPVLDLSTGRVVGVVKRSQDTSQPLGAFFLPMADILPLIPDVKDENEALNSDPARNDMVARQIWGGLITKAASALAGNSIARGALAEALGLSEEELIGDNNAQARRVARELFILDLERLLPRVKQFEGMTDRRHAFTLFDAVATCTSYEGEQWVAAEVAAELAAQVDLLAGNDVPEGRVIHLRTDDDLRGPYIRRADRDDTWWPALKCGVFSHEVDRANGLPEDLERDLRSQIVGRFPGSSKVAGLDAQELDDEGRRRWDGVRPLLISRLRKQHVIGLLPPNVVLDDRMVASLTRDYQLVLLTADTGPPPRIGGKMAYQALDPDVDSDRASEAFWAYEAARAKLADPEDGGSYP